jgi:hypothetical protein
MKLTKTVVTGTVLSLAFLANCDFIMGSDWTYGEAEMRSAVEGTWKLTRASGEAVTLIAKQGTAAKQHGDRGFVKSAAACSSRSFVRQAAACINMTNMPLDITAAGHEIVGAELVVASTTFTAGTLRFKLDGALVEARVDPTGAVESAGLYVPGKDEKIMLQRVAR